MTTEDIKENLCYYDNRNPDYIESRYNKEDDCYCDNCFKGRTQLAEELLKYIQQMEDLKDELGSKEAEIRGKEN